MFPLYANLKNLLRSCRVRDALQAGTASYHVANQLAALLESVSLQASSRQTPGGMLVDQASSSGGVPQLGSQLHLGTALPAVSSGLSDAAESDSMETEVGRSSGRSVEFCDPCLLSC